VLLLGGRPAGPRPGWPLAAPLAAFAAWSIVSALAAARPLESLVSAKSLLSLAAFWVVLWALPDARAARRFAAGLLAALALVSAFAIVQVAACPAPDGTPALWRVVRGCTRARGFFSIYMTLAGVLVLVLVTALPALGRGRPWAVPAWLLGLAALGLTYARGAWVGFAAGVATVVLAGRRWALGLFALGVLLGALVLVPGVRDRLGTIGSFTDDSTRERMAMLDAGLRMARDRPLTGVGPGQVKHAYPDYAGPEAVRRSTSHLHDTPLQILAERGVPGLAAWLWLWVAFFAGAVAALRRIPADGERALALGAIAAVAAFLVAGLFEYNFGDTEVLMLACAVMALPFVAERG